jgi:hypothetical protein
MEQSQSTVNLDKAMLAAQKNIEGAVKDSKNPFFRSNYAGLPEVIEACKKQLNDAGIYVTQLLDSDGTNEYLITMFVHSETGEFRSSKMKIQNTGEGIQAKMSEQTYLRRYMLQAAAFMPSLDDDGEGAMGRNEKKSETKAPEKKSTRVDPATHTAPAATNVTAQNTELAKLTTIVQLAEQIEAPIATPPTFSKKAVAAAKGSEDKKPSSWD